MRKGQKLNDSEMKTTFLGKRGRRTEKNLFTSQKITILDEEFTFGE